MVTIVERRERNRKIVAFMRARGLVAEAATKFGTTEVNVRQLCKQYRVRIIKPLVSPAFLLALREMVECKLSDDAVAVECGIAVDRVKRLRQVARACGWEV